MKMLPLLVAAAALGLALPQGPAHAQDYTDHVVIVLDASGSMKGALRGTDQNKMQAAKAALKEVLKQVPPSTHVGLLVFSASNMKEDWAYPLGPRDDAALMKAIDLPNPGSGTPLGRYIKKGADRLLQERATQFGYGTYRLLVVTDGEAADQDLVERYTPEVMARGITMDVIGVAMNKAHTLATKVHSYRAANDAAALKQALAEVFAEVSTTATDVGTDETFALIAPIPNPVASAMIEALAKSGNQPIGEKPPGAVAPPPQSSQSSATPAQHSHSSRSVHFSPILLILGVLFFMVLVGVVFLWLLIRLIGGRRR